MKILLVVYIQILPSAQIKLLDVGQGDAIYIRLEDNVRILVDGGSSYEIDKHFQSFYPFNLCPLNILILTHPHADHLEGLLRLAYRCPNATVISSPSNYSSSMYTQWKNLVEKNPTYYMTKGDKFSIASMNFEVLWPPEGFEYKDINDVSLALLVNTVETSILLTGDLAAEYFSTFYIDYPMRPLRYFKASHHGSIDGLNTSFIKDYHPDFCLISVGKNNPYRHPSTEVTSYFSSIGCQTYRTDINGTITLPIS